MGRMRGGKPKEITVRVHVRALAKTHYTHEEGELLCCLCSSYATVCRLVLAKGTNGPVYSERAAV